jgi:hypothetical protein
VSYPGKQVGSRIYQRAFNYDEARARHRAGETCAQLAAEYGVSSTRVWQVINPEGGRRAAEASEAWSRSGKCPDCGGPMRRNGRSQRCRPCYLLLRATTVRPTELQCSTCREWKPDDAFPFNRRESFTRRGRHGQCRTCQTIARRSYRQRHPEASRAYDRAYKAKRREKAA